MPTREAESGWGPPSGFARVGRGLSSAPGEGHPDVSMIADHGDIGMTSHGDAHCVDKRWSNAWRPLPST
jgi:hypothetical protein